MERSIDAPAAGAESSLEAYRAEVRAQLASRLQLRSADAGRLQVLGAGVDDLDAGRDYLGSLAEVGLSTPMWPPHAGGRGATRAEASIIDEEMRPYEAADLYPFGVGVGLVGPMLLVHGTDEQQRRWCGPIGAGRETWCQLFSEPGAGSDLAGLTTRAVRDGDTWRVDGQKVWSSRAHFADWGLLLARTDPTVPKHAGITAFGVDMRSPGVDIRPMRQMNGDAHFSEVFLDAVELSDADRIGEPGDGWKVAVTVLSHERAGIGSGGTTRGGGGLRRSQVLEHFRSHHAGDDPITRQRAAAVLAQLEVMRWTGRRSIATARRLGRPGPEGSGGKVRTTEVTRAAADLGLQLLGGDALLAEGEWQTLFLTSPSMGIRGGTDEIQRNIMGERVLGLPAEPRVDRDVPFDQTLGSGRTGRRNLEGDAG